jgi:hypothetical protein
MNKSYIQGLVKFSGIGLTTIIDDESIAFEAKEQVKKYFNNSTLLTNGKTIGEANREEAHKYLNEWIDRVSK